MRGRNKTNNEFMVELNELRERNAELEAREEEHGLARKTFERSEMLLRKAFDTIPDLVSIIDRNHRILISNWHGGYDYVPEEVRSGNPVCHEVYYGSKTPCEPCPVSEVFCTGRPVSLEKRNPNIGQLEIRALPIFDESGNVALVMNHIRDITAQKETEDRFRQTKEEWERTFDAIVDPVMIADVQH
jgi:PAS domain-containing protein